MNVDTLQMNHLRTPSKYFQKSWEDERIAKGATMTMAMTMTMSLGIGNGNVTETDCHMEDSNATHSFNMNRDVSMHLPPLLERQRSSSPRSVTDFLSADIFGKDCHVITDIDDDYDDGADCFPDPLPLVTSASADLICLMQEYFNHGATKDILPKTKLTFYADREHKFEDVGVNETDGEFKHAEKLLGEFPLIKFSGKQDDPFSFLASADAKSTQTLVEIDNRNGDQHDKNKNVTSPSKSLVSTDSKSTKPTVGNNKENYDHYKKNKSKVKVGTKKASKRKPASKAKESIKKKKKIAPKNTITIEKVRVRKMADETENDTSTLVQKDTWDLNYRKLKTFYLKNEHSCVLRSDPDTKLSGWVKRQRNNLKQGRLSPSQIRRLDDVDFTWNRLEQAWQCKYNLLKIFASEHGRSYVPSRYDRSLAEWTQRQRREHRAKKRTMTLARIQKLEAIPSWSWMKPTKDESEWESEMESIGKKTE